jgi:hypothetical protein
MPAVVEVVFEKRKRRLHVRFANDITLVAPVDAVEDLAGAASGDLERFAIESGGLSLHWPTLDASLWVPGLLAGITGSRRWMAARLGSAGKAAKVNADAARGSQGE